MKHTLVCLSFLLLLALPSLNAAKISVASYLARRLVEIGSTTVFGVTGDYSYLFLHAVEANANLTRVSNHNELEAAYAAWAYARAHPKQAPGVISVTYSAGSYTALTGLVGANIDNVPVIFVSGAPPLSSWQILDSFGVVAHHIANDLPTEKDVFGKFTVASELIQNAQRAAQQIDSAILAALTWKRPVYIGCFTDVWTQLINEPTTPINPATVSAFVPNLVGTSDAVKATVAALKNSTFPAIFAGRELRQYGLQNLFEQFVNTFNIPFFVTANAKGILSEANTKYISNVAHAAKIDLLLEIGTHYGDVESRQIGQFAPNAKVQIRARKGAVVTANRVIYSAVQLTDYLQQLYNALVAANYQNTAYVASTMHFEYPKTSIPPLLNPTIPITYNSFINHFRWANILNDNTVLAMDISILNLYAVNNVPVGRDGWFSDNGLLTIGWTGGASLGIKAAVPNKRVVVFVGDGGFQNLPQGLATAGELGHNTIFFLLHNNVYAIEQVIEDKAPYTNHSVPFFAENLLADWDYLKLAKSYGIDGCQASNHGQLALCMGLAPPASAKKAFVIEVMLPLRDYAGMP